MSKRQFTGPVAAAETTGQPATLAEQAAMRVEEKLVAQFSLPSSPQRFSFKAAARLVECGRTPFLMAAQDMELIPATAGQPQVIESLSKASSGLLLVPDQILPLNRHPLMRTLSNREISNRLGIPVVVLAETLRELQLEPVARPVSNKKPTPGEKSFYYGYFDLDQQARIEAAAGGSLKPDDDLIPISQLRDRLGMSGRLFQVLQERMEFYPVYVTPRGGTGEEPHATPEMAEEIARAVAGLRKAYRRSQHRKRDRDNT